MGHEQEPGDRSGRSSVRSFAVQRRHQRPQRPVGRDEEPAARRPTTAPTSSAAGAGSRSTASTSTTPRASARALRAGALYIDSQGYPDPRPVEELHHRRSQSRLDRLVPDGLPLEEGLGRPGCWTCGTAARPTTGRAGALNHFGTSKESQVLRDGGNYVFGSDYFKKRARRRAGRRNGGAARRGVVHRSGRHFQRRNFPVPRRRELRQAARDLRGIPVRRRVGAGRPRIQLDGGPGRGTEPAHLDRLHRHRSRDLRAWLGLGAARGRLLQQPADQVVGLLTNPEPAEASHDTLSQTGHVRGPGDAVCRVRQLPHRARHRPGPQRYD